MKIIRKYKRVGVDADVKISLTINPTKNIITVLISPVYLFFGVEKSDITSSGYTSSLRIKRPVGWIDSKPYEEELYQELKKRFKHIKEEANKNYNNMIKLREKYSKINLPENFNHILREEKFERIINDITEEDEH